MSSYAIMLTDTSGTFTVSVSRGGTVSGGTTVSHSGDNDLTAISTKDARKALESALQVISNDRAAGN